MTLRALRVLRIAPLFWLRNGGLRTGQEAPPVANCEAPCTWGVLLSQELQGLLAVLCSWHLLLATGMLSLLCLPLLAVLLALGPAGAPLSPPCQQLSSDHTRGSFLPLGDRLPVFSTNCSFCIFQCGSCSADARGHLPFPQPFLLLFLTALQTTARVSIFSGMAAPSGEMGKRAGSQVGKQAGAEQCPESWRLARAPAGVQNGAASSLARGAGRVSRPLRCRRLCLGHAKCRWAPGLAGSASACQLPLEDLWAGAEVDLAASRSGVGLAGGQLFPRLGLGSLPCSPHRHCWSHKLWGAPLSGRKGISCFRALSHRGPRWRLQTGTLLLAFGRDG